MGFATFRLKRQRDLLADARGVVGGVQHLEHGPPVLASGHRRSTVRARTR